MPKVNKGPHLEINDRGVWEVRWTDAGRSKRVSTRSTDRAEATRFLAGFCLEVDRQKSDEVTTADVLDIYLREHVDHGPVIDKRRQRDAAAHLRQHFGPLLPSQITPTDCTQYAKGRMAGTVGRRRATSNGTIRRELNTLRAAYGHMVKSRRMTQQELPYIALPAAPGARDIWLTETESPQFLAAAKQFGTPRAYLFCVIALNTASRKRAIETLTWDRIDMDAGLIHFQPQGRAQSAKRRVPVPISAELRSVLECTPPEQRHGFVLGTDHDITRAFETVCRAAAREYKNSKFLTINRHTLRHTWATQAARAGVDLYQIAGVLGDSLATVQKNYLHHSPDHLRAAVDFRQRQTDTDVLRASMRPTERIRSIGRVGWPTMADKNGSEPAETLM